jgi:hypothetical protein
MAKKKEAEVAEEDLQEVVLPEKDPDEGLETVPSSEIEVEEAEASEEEVEEKPSEPDGTAKAMLDGFNMLRDELRSRGEAGQPAPAPVQGETDEDFDKRVNEELFKENPAGMLKKAINREARKIVETEVAPILGSIMEDAFNNAEFRLKNDEKDGPIFRKFEPEIKKLLKTLSPAQQKNPQVLKAVFDKIRSDHVEEVIEMEIERRGKGSPKVSSSAPARRAPLSEGSSSVQPSSTSRRVMVPRSELAALQRKADQLGIDVEVLVERRGQR